MAKEPEQQRIFSANSGSKLHKLSPIWSFYTEKTMNDFLHTDLFVRYIHFLGIFVMFSLLTIEHTVLKDRVDSGWIKRIAIVDIAFGISALVVLLAGIGLWFWVGKPAGFYNDNWIFHAKVSLFILIGLLSFFPSWFIRQQRNSLHESTTVPRFIVHIIRLELLFLCIIPLLAVLMANGVGYTY